MLCSNALRDLPFNNQAIVSTVAILHLAIDLHSLKAEGDLKVTILHEAGILGYSLGGEDEVWRREIHSPSRVLMHCGPPMASVAICISAEDDPFALRKLAVFCNTCADDLFAKLDPLSWSKVSFG
jgi:hypothetical protein